MPSSVINSDDGVISGTSGLKSSGGDDGVLKIQNNGVDAVTVAADGDVTLAADLSVTGNLLFNSGFGSAAVAYGCRAWVNFDGTGTVAIRASGNVSSITDNGTGDYTVNFTTAMPDADYSVSGSANDSGGSSSYVWLGTGAGVYGNVSRTTTSVRVQVIFSTIDVNDSSTVNVNIFR